MDTISIYNKPKIDKRNYLKVSSPKQPGNFKYDHYHDHDRISVSSLNTAINVDDSRSQHNAAQRRSSVLRKNWAQHTDVPFIIGAHIAEESHGLCGKILLALSWFLIFIFFPFSLFITLKVVQEYE